MPTNLIWNSTAVSESIEQISELYGLNLGSLVAPKNGQFFLSTDPFLISTSVSESIGQISKLYGFN